MSALTPQRLDEIEALELAMGMLVLEQRELVRGYRIGVKRSMGRCFQRDAEIARLQSICVSAHDRLLRGDNDAELLAILAEAWSANHIPDAG